MLTGVILGADLGFEGCIQVFQMERKIESSSQMLCGVSRCLMCAQARGIPSQTCPQISQSVGKPGLTRDILTRKCGHSSHRGSPKSPGISSLGCSPEWGMAGWDGYMRQRMERKLAATAKLRARSPALVKGSSASGLWDQLSLPPVLITHRPPRFLSHSFSIAYAQPHLSTTALPSCRIDT